MFHKIAHSVYQPWIKTTFPHLLLETAKESLKTPQNKFLKCPVAKLLIESLAFSLLCRMVMGRWDSRSLQLSCQIGQENLSWTNQSSNMDQSRIIEPLMD